MMMSNKRPIRGGQEVILKILNKIYIMKINICERFLLDITNPILIINTNSKLIQYRFNTDSTQIQHRFNMDLTWIRYGTIL